MPPLARVRRRLVPFLFLLYLVSYLDRVNVGFAALRMNAALGFSASTYGFGAGIFFVLYVIFEIPSNLVLDRIGVRIWIARIMITWGIVSTATMFVRGASSFFALRFLLGAAEAGFFPGIILYLTRWFPAAERARAVAWFMTATALAGVIGGPVSGALLGLDGVLGLAGWQWLFALEGLPAVALGIAVLAWLPDRPRDAAWLTAAERDAIERAIAAEHAEVASSAHHALGPALASGRVWLLAVLYFTIVLSFYGVSLWLPQIVRSFSYAGDVGIGVLSAVPVRGRCDRDGRRRLAIRSSRRAGRLGGVDGGGWRRGIRLRGHHLECGAFARRAVACGGRRLEYVGTFLGDASAVPGWAGRGRGHCAHQLGGQYRRLRRSLRARVRARTDGQLQFGAHRPRRVPSRCRAACAVGARAPGACDARPRTSDVMMKC